MTIDKLERGQQLLKNIEDYESRLHAVENGLIVARYQGQEIFLEEDIFNELIATQIKKDLNFLKERFEKL